jgi:hypothetical protein
MNRISIAEVASVERIIELLNLVHNRFKHSFERDTLLSKNCYVAIRFCYEAKYVSFAKQTKHNTSIKTSAKNANMSLVDNHQYNNHEMLEIVYPHDVSERDTFYMIKNCIIALRNVEDSLSDLVNLSTYYKSQFLEYLNIAKIKVIETRYLLEYKLETNYPAYLDRKRH